MLKKIIFALLALVLAVCVFSTSVYLENFSITGKAQIKEERTTIFRENDDSEPISYPKGISENDKNEITATIKEYIRLSKQNNLIDIKKLVTKVSDSDYFAFIENTEKSNKKNSSKSLNTKGEIPSSSAFSKIYYNSLTKNIPEIIYVGQRDFHKISNVQIKNKNVKILVELENPFRQTRIIKQNYYLTKDNSGRWKIFLIEQNIGNLDKKDETFL